MDDTFQFHAHDDCPTVIAKAHGEQLEDVLPVLALTLTHIRIETRVECTRNHAMSSHNILGVDYGMICAHICDWTNSRMPISRRALLFGATTEIIPPALCTIHFKWLSPIFEKLDIVGSWMTNIQCYLLSTQSRLEERQHCHLSMCSVVLTHGIRSLVSRKPIRGHCNHDCCVFQVEFPKSMRDIASNRDIVTTLPIPLPLRMQYFHASTTTWQQHTHMAWSLPWQTQSHLSCQSVWRSCPHHMQTLSM